MEEGRSHGISLSGVIRPGLCSTEVMTGGIGFHKDDAVDTLGCRKRDKKAYVYVLSSQRSK